MGFFEVTYQYFYFKVLGNVKFIQNNLDTIMYEREWSVQFALTQNRRYK